MKRAIITGGTGFVGANLAERLVKEGYEVHLLVREGYHPWRIEHVLPHLQLFKADLLDRERLTIEMKRIKPDWIFHLATYGAYSWQDYLEATLQTNFIGTVNLVEASREVGFEAFINTGSSSEYGAKDHAATEDELLEPNSYYAVAKASSTLFCSYTARRFQIPILTLRLFSVYGPFEEPGRLIPTLIVNGMQGKFPSLAHPDIARDFIFTEDVNDAYLLMASSSNTLPSDGVYNVGTGHQTRLRDIVEMTRAIFHIEAEPVWGSMENRSWDTNIWVANNQKLCRAGWNPLHDIRDGLLNTIEWFKQNPSLIDRIYQQTH